MPGCRKLDASSPTPAARGPMDLSAYVRHRVRPPRAMNDNRRAPTVRAWRWALLIGAVPVVGMMAILSNLF